MEYWEKLSLPIYNSKCHEDEQHVCYIDNNITVNPVPIGINNQNEKLMINYR